MTEIAIAKGFVSRFDLQREMSDDSSVETVICITLVESWQSDRGRINLMFQGVKSFSYPNINDAIWLDLIQEDVRDNGLDGVSYRVYDPEHKTGFELYCSNVENLSHFSNIPS